MTWPHLIKLKVASKSMYVHNLVHDFELTKVHVLRGHFEGFPRTCLVSRDGSKCTRTQMYSYS